MVKKKIRQNSTENGNQIINQGEHKIHDNVAANQEPDELPSFEIQHRVVPAVTVQDIDSFFLDIGIAIFVDKSARKIVAKTGVFGGL